MTNVPDTPPLIRAIGLVKIFKVADLEVVALQGLDLEIRAREFLALVGPSGSGKSTLLSALGGLDRPSAGRLFVGDRDLLALSPAQLTTYRREQIGFVWQQTGRNLLPYLTARENIELLMTLAGTTGKARRAWADELLDAVGIREHADRRPPQLSGGQQQRVAIACALANRPAVLLGDEPTGEVDWPTAQSILALLRDLRDRYGLTIVIVTHDPRVAAQSDRTVAIRDGRTSSETVYTATSAAIPIQETHKQNAQELVVVDAAGRLQLSGEHRHLAGIGRRARVEVVDGGLLIRPGDEAPPGEGLAAVDVDDYDALNSSQAPPRRARLPWRRRKA